MTGKTLKYSKKYKSSGSANIKEELYRALRESRICVKTLQKVLQNIIAK